MGRINSRAKGCRGEREVRDLFRERNYESRRGQQFSGGDESPDVVVPGVPQIHLEVKLVQNLNVQKAMEQAIRDGGPDKIPTVFHRKNGTKWLVTMNADDWFNFLETYLYHEKDHTQDHEAKKLDGNLSSCTSGVGS